MAPGTRRNAFLFLPFILAVTPSDGVAQAGRADADAQVAPTVEYLANEGVLLEAGDASVVIDGLFGDGLPEYPSVPAARRDSLERAMGRFGDVDLLLVTHLHRDHFDPTAVARHLEANPTAVLVAPGDAIDALGQEIDVPGLEDRIQPLALTPGERMELDVGGTAIVALGLDHGGIGHVGYRVELPGLSALHLGDAQPRPSDLAPLLGDRERPDVAFIPFWVLLGEEGAALAGAIRAKCVAAFHFERKIGDAARRVVTALPNVTIFDRPGQRLARGCGEESSFAHAKDLAGSWLGHWTRDADTLDVTMRFRMADGAWQGEFDSERLRVEGIPFTEVAFDTPVVSMRLVGDGDGTTTVFEGRVVGDSLTGTLVEDGASGSFAFARSAEARPALHEEEIRFRNGEVELAGTLLLPSGSAPFPAVVFLHGSGPEGRWASRFIARRLARQGIAALIWDKRGVGGSGGSWEEASFEDQAADVAAAVALVRARSEIDPHRVGIHGHSQGGTIAPLAAARSEADFVIGSAASGLSMADVEVYSIGNAIGISSLPPDEAALAKAYVDAIVDVAYRGAPREDLMAAAARAEGHDWYFEPPDPEDPYWSFSRRIADFDPLSWWGRIRVPVLLVYGSGDERVPAEASRDAIVKTIGDKAPVESRIFEGADHTFRIRRAGDVWPRTVEGYPEVLLEWLKEVTEA